MRKTSRDCVIPDPIDLKGLSEAENIGSPVLKIDDYEAVGNDGQRNRSRPITLQRIKDEERDCISIQELSESPQRFSGGGTLSDGSKTRLSVTSSHDSIDGDHMVFQPPNSPLLVAMRTAVDSLNQYDDFDILDEIGSGFFAEVFKVSRLYLGSTVGV